MFKSRFHLPFTFDRPFVSPFLLVALAANIIGAIFAFVLLRDLNQVVAKAEEASQPARIEVIRLVASNCQDCFKIDEPLAELKNEHVTIDQERSVEYDSDEGRQLVDSLKIERLPTFVMSGKVTSEKLADYVENNGQIRDGRFVYTKVIPVFIDTSTGAERGRIDVTIMNDSALCADCGSPDLVVNLLKANGFILNDPITLSPWSQDGSALVSAYQISTFPAIILSSDAKLYDKLSESKLGSFAEDGRYVIRQIAPPFYDLAQRRVVGPVKLIYLADSTCAECYDPAQHKTILEDGFGVVVASERTVDIASAEGKSLVAGYDIASIPTVLISSDAKYYSGLTSAWTNVGSIESDGWYVFRQNEKMGKVTYKDLSQNEIVTP